jgi:hypothetical protein
MQSYDERFHDWRCNRALQRAERELALKGPYHNVVPDDHPDEEPEVAAAYKWWKEEMGMGCLGYPEPLPIVDMYKQHLAKRLVEADLEREFLAKERAIEEAFEAKERELRDRGQRL